MGTDIELNKVIKHFVGNVQSLTEYFNGEHLEAVMYRAYESFLLKYFGVTRNVTGSDYITIYGEITKCGRPGGLSRKQATITMIDKLIDINFMTEFITRQLEYRKNVDANCIKRGISKYKKRYNID